MLNGFLPSRTLSGGQPIPGWQSLVKIRKSRFDQWLVHSAWRHPNARGSTVQWVVLSIRAATLAYWLNTNCARTLRGGGFVNTLVFFRKETLVIKKMITIDLWITHPSLPRWTMLKQWLTNDGKTDSINVEEKYTRWTEELRSDKYSTVPCLNSWLWVMAITKHKWRNQNNIPINQTKFGHKSFMGW